MLALDHVGFACRNVEKILPIFRRVGFLPTEPRELEAIDPTTDAPKSLGQISAHLMMHDTYIELSAVPDPATGNHLEPFLERYEGLHILALRDADIESCRRRIARDGFALTELQRAQREIRYGSRHGDARFKWFMLEHASAPEGLVCVVENQTPELVYQPEVTTHPNGATGLAGVIVCSAKPDITLDRLAQVCDATAAEPDNEKSHTLKLGNASLKIVSPDVLQTLYPGYIPPAIPALVGLEIHVADIDVLIAHLKAGSVDFARTDDSNVTIQLPGPVNGILTFTQQTNANPISDH